MARLELKKCPYCGSEVDTVSVKEKDGNLCIEVKAKDRWISCIEMLPEQSEEGQPNGVRCSDCVMITDGRLIHMAYCVNDEWRYADCGQVSDFVEYKVTHWMPLPSMEGL